MKIKLKLSFFALLIAANIAGQTQHLPLSVRRNASTYIYRISDKEAEKILIKTPESIGTQYFHTLVDSFSIGTKFEKTLPAGHYLHVFTQENRQTADYVFVPAFDVKILNNNTDLCLQVYDLQGNEIKNALVKVNSKKLKFDSKTNCYMERKSNRKGLLKITYNDLTAYYQLDRTINSSTFSRNAKTFLYRPIWQVGDFFSRTWEKITCLWEDWRCDDDSDWKFQQKYDGYLVFNKPKYLPKDTVRFKAFIIEKKSGKPLDVPVKVSIQADKYRQLAVLQPFHAGAYEYAFALHDSLNLKLDRSYSIALKENNDNQRTYINGRFSYEDYELSKLKMNIRTVETLHFAGSPFSVFLKATDENDLPLPDARVKITAKTLKGNQFFDKATFLPDTLFTLEKPLLPRGETEIAVSDSLLPKANFDYALTFTLLTSDNRQLTQTQNISYFYLQKAFELSLINDSLECVYRENGLKKEQFAEIFATDNFDDKTSVYQGITPLKIPIIPYYSHYIAKSAGVENSINIASQPSMLQCFSQRTNDSVFFSVQNPRNLSFTYNIYKTNTEKTRGSGIRLDYRVKEKSARNYFVSLRYLWGGEVKEETYRIPLYDKKLNINVEQPLLVYPGQKINTEITVTDQKGKAVEGVDLTAFSLTNKFNYSQPKLPGFSTQYANKKIINNFKINDLEEPSIAETLNYDYWNALAQLDTLEFYQFLYPKQNEIYRCEYEPVDTITQFAPFVFDNQGNIKPIHVIYVDSRPVYFSWSTNRQPYSFRISPGKHFIRLRLYDREILLLDFEIFNHKKLIFSLNENSATDKIINRKTENYLQEEERKILYNYIFPYRRNFGNAIATIRSGENVQYLSKYSKSNTKSGFAGPVLGNLTFNIQNDYSLNFRHEPHFEYDFAPNILKMREIDRKYYPKNLSKFSNIETVCLNDTVLTIQQVEREWRNYLDNQRREQRTNLMFSNPQKTTFGFGQLQLDFTSDFQKVGNPLNMLLFRLDESKYLRVYNGITKQINQLDEGYYRLITLFPGEKYNIEDSIQIKKNGVNHLKINITEKLQRDTFGINLNKMMDDLAVTPRKDWETNYGIQQTIDKIYDSYQKQFTYTGDGYFVSGLVFDVNNSEPLIGVSVVIKGTTYGAFTDIDGKYSLKVPYNRNVLVFSYIGYKRAELDLSESTTTAVGLEEDPNLLEEVVVTGYGSQKRSSLTGSVQTISISNALEGRVAGIVSENSSEKIWIRGISTVRGNNLPLSEIDEIAYTENSNEPAAFDEAFLQASLQTSSIRKNFSDYAYWQPRLMTDKNGKARFEIIFPDDVTSWDTYILAMNDKKQSGQTQGNIRSFKPIMAQLSTPRFLLAGDTTNVIGKSMNYTTDSIHAKSSFEQNGKILQEKESYFAEIQIDTLQIVAPVDSFALRYTLHKNDGYFDGEEREIPVFPLGLEEAKGDFLILDKDTTFTKQFDNQNVAMHLYANANALDVLTAEIERVIRYRYLCNEQLASKLKACLLKKRISEMQGIDFDGDKQINQLISELKKRQNKDGLWGWWENAETNLLFSNHILSALAEAKKQKFKVNIDSLKIGELAVIQLDNTNNNGRKIDWLRTLKQLGAPIDYQSFIDSIPQKSLSFHDFLRLMELRQQLGMKINTDTLKIFRNETLFGSVYFDHSQEKVNSFDLSNNRIQNTLLVYKILKNEDAEKNKPILDKIRMYFFENKTVAGWRNTYETVNIVETVLPDILGGKRALNHTVLTVSGDINQTVYTKPDADKKQRGFPYEAEFIANQGITITKSGDEPVFFTLYQHEWNAHPQEKQNDFIIKTRFEEDKTLLKAGEKVKLIATLEVKKDAGYVMVNIPIPAGCSYGEKSQYRYPETHREYFRNETAIFCNRLKSGIYTFEIELLPRFSGVYHLNPAQAELMYFPAFNANEAMKQVKIIP